MNRQPRPDASKKPVKDLSIISVNWNSVNYLRKCLATIQAETRGIDFEVIVVDNDTSGNSADILTAEFPDTTIIFNGENVGFARANNLGFAHSSGKAILFLNPDTELIGPAIATMLSHLHSLPDAGLVGCKLLNSDRTVQTSCIQRFPTIVNQVLGIEWLRLRWPRLRFWGIWPLFQDMEEGTEVEVVSGACLMIKRDAFEKAGFFAEEYFMYAEDVSLCHKVRKIGLKAYYVGNASVIHHGGKSSKRSKVNQWTTVQQRRAILKFLQSTRGPVYGAFYRMAMGTTAVFRLILLLLLLPLRGVVFNKTGLNSTIEKWSAILKWAFGLYRTEQRPNDSL